LQASELAVGLGVQGPQVPAEAAQRVGVVLPGLDPDLDQPGAQASDGADWVQANGEGDAQADRVSDSVVFQPPRNRPT
jgi:hypothetical protein